MFNFQEMNVDLKDRNTARIKLERENGHFLRERFLKNIRIYW